MVVVNTTESPNESGVEHSLNEYRSEVQKSFSTFILFWWFLQILWLSLPPFARLDMMIKDSHFFTQMSNPQQENEEEYVPPGKRLVTPADVVELDPNMTVENGRICFTNRNYSMWELKVVK